MEKKGKEERRPHANGPDKRFKKWEAASTTASTFPSTSLGGQQFQDWGKEGAAPDILPYSSHGLDRSYRHLQRFPSPPQSPKHLLTLLSNSNDAISTSLKNVAVVARASLGGCMCLPVSAEKIVISQTLDYCLFCFAPISWTIPTNVISLSTSPGKSS